MFVPVMHNRRLRNGRGGPPTRPLVAVATVLGALVAGLIPAILSKKDAGAGEYVVLGLVIAAVAAAGGFAVAKAIGRQGKV